MSSDDGSGSSCRAKGRWNDPKRLQRALLSVASQELNVSRNQAKLLLQVQKTNTRSWRGRCARWGNAQPFLLRPGKCWWSPWKTPPSGEQLHRLTFSTSLTPGHAFTINGSLGTKIKIITITGWLPFSQELMSRSVYPYFSMNFPTFL